MFSSMGSEIVPASAIDRLQRSGAEYCKAIASLLAMTDTHDKSLVILSSDTESNKMAEKIEILVRSCSSAFVVTIFDEYRVEDVSVDRLQRLNNILEMVFRINLEEEHAPSEFHSFPTCRFLVCASINGETQDASGYVQFKYPSQITSLVAILK
ncbi:hypothetical protein PC112_g25084 [Phytophthora cactorum]|nr:hypothetical protein PC112_g25084 [Phytophthora cactorum]